MIKQSSDVHPIHYEVLTGKESCDRFHIVKFHSNDSNENYQSIIST